MPDSRLTFKILSQPYVPGDTDFLDLLYPIRTAAQLADTADPINTIDKFRGRRAWDSTANEPVWASGPAAADAWLRGGGDIAATAAELGAIADDINTIGKYVGKLVYDTAGGLLYAADGPATDDTWTLIDGVGSTQITPS